MGKKLQWCRMKNFYISKSLSNGEMQVKTTPRYHFTPVRMAIINKVINNKFWIGLLDVRMWSHCNICAFLVGMQNGAANMTNSSIVIQKIKNKVSVQDEFYRENVIKSKESEKQMLCINSYVRIKCWDLYILLRTENCLFLNLQQDSSPQMSFYTHSYFYAQLQVSTN